MDGFIRKINQKVNLPGVCYFKGRFIENPSNKKVSNLFKNVVLQIQLSNACRCIYIYSAMKSHLMFWSFKSNILSQTVAKSQLSYAI